MLSMGTQDYIEKVADVLKITNLFDGIYSARGAFSPFGVKPSQVMAQRQSGEFGRVLEELKRRLR